MQRIPIFPRVRLFQLRPSANQKSKVCLLLLNPFPNHSSISSDDPKENKRDAMGQILDKFQGREWRQRQIKKITDQVFDRFKSETGRANLTFDEVYIAVLLVYNDINKRLPGPHFDPPSKGQVRSMIKECDMNLDGEIDREEFVIFIRRLTEDTLIVVSQGLIISLVVAPTVAVATKRTTEGVPVVGKMVQKLPNSVYASLVTLAVVWFQASRNEI